MRPARPPRPLGVILAAAWEGRGGELALSNSAGGVSLSATDLSAAVSTFGTSLALRLGPPAAGTPRLIGLALTGAAWAVAALACWSAGCAWAALEPGADVAGLGLAAVVAPGPGSGQGLDLPAPAGLPTIHLPPGFPGAPCQGDVAPQPPPWWWPAPPPAAFCYALPTSGSSGPAPRWVRGTWGGVAARAGWAAAALGVGPGDTVACVSRPTAVDAVAASLIPLLLGAAVRMVADPTQATAGLGLAGATVLTATPSAWTGLLASGALPPSLRLAIASGEPLPGQAAASIAAALPGSAAFLNVYGLTEAAGDSTSADVRAWLRGAAAAAASSPASSSSSAPVGWPVAGAVVWVTAQPADPALPPAADGQEGVVVIAGPGVAAGYAGGEGGGGSATRFVDSLAGRAVITGDLGRLDPATGALHLSGRADRVVKGAGGGRVCLDAVEAAATTSCPGVAAAAAVTLPPAPSLGLAVVGVPGLTVEAVRGWAAASLPPAARPGPVAILPALPVLPGGKVDRAAVVRSLLLLHSSSSSSSSGAAPGLPAPGEAAVAAVMAAVLAARRAAAGSGEDGGVGLPLEANTDFVGPAAGGDSLDVAAVAARLGVSVGLVLAGRTPRGVARLLAGGAAAAGQPAAGPAALPPLLAGPACAAGGWRAAWRVSLAGCVDAPPACLGAGCLLATSHAGDAACVDAGAGAVAWRAELGAPADEGAAACGGLVAVALASGGLAVLDVETGAPAGSLRLNGSPRGPPTPAAQGGSGWWVGTREGAVVRVSAVAPAPAITATLDAGARLAGAPVSGGGFLAGCAPGSGAALLRVVEEEGGSGPVVAPWPRGSAAGRWSASPAAAASASPIIVGGLLVVVADTAGCAAAFSVATGREAWRVPSLGGPVAAAPAVVGGAASSSPALLIFPVRADPGLVALDAATGHRVWAVSLPGDAAATGAASTPALAAGGSVVVAAAPDRGCVLAFSAADGSLLAAARLPAAAFGGPTAVALDGGRTLIACGCRDDAVWGLELER